MKFRFLTAGESHGKCLNAIIEGLPAGIKIDEDFINAELAKRQTGYGRGGRMQIETDRIIINSGVRFSYSTGAPICIEIINKDFENWQSVMSTSEIDKNDGEALTKIEEKKITKLRPGHADLAGAIKYNHSDVRNILERSSARETAARVAVGAIAKCLLNELEIEICSHVIQIGNTHSEICTANMSFEEIREKAGNSDLMILDDTAYLEMKSEIDKAAEAGVTLGGKFEIIVHNTPIGLGSFVHWDRKLDGLLAQALMSINGVKSVEIGNAEMAATATGDEFHDEIFYEDNKFKRNTNNAGGIEGGMSNGEDIIIKAVMKPIPTMKTPLNSVDLITKEPYKAHFERSDVCAVPACAVVAEAMTAIVLVEEILQKFGSDSIEELKSNYTNYCEYTKGK